MKLRSLLPLAFASALAGCQSVLHVNDEDAQAIVNQRVVGTSIGDFITRYGAPVMRDEARDGSLTILWEGGPPKVGPGPRGLEERICRVRLSTDRNGRILAAPIVRDGPGQRHLSLCVEVLPAT
ncbi:hypothetical protein [Nocardioides sp.]|uniref:hypothetical protein n=1 Tax=Nocardioides sp. TaxID=35761 RepID=UPI0031FEBD8E|nr:hypothetical protein [Nocardioides sp.]